MAKMTDMQQLAALLWAKRISMLAYIGLGLILAVIYLHLAVYQYRATLVVVSTQNQSQGLASRFGDVASLAGINLPSASQVSPFALYPDVITSRAAAERLIETNPDVFHHLFKSQWNSQTNSWRVPSGPVPALARTVKAMLGFPKTNWAPPGPDELRELILGKVNLSIDLKNPIITITYLDEDPVFAQKFLNSLNEATDHVLRVMTQDRASKYSHYLDEQLRTVQATEMRQILVNALSQQETALMMSASDTPFAAQALGKTTTSLRPTSPVPMAVLLLGVLFGLVLGVADALLNLRIVESALAWAGQQFSRTSPPRTAERGR